MLTIIVQILTFPSGSHKDVPFKCKFLGNKQGMIDTDPIYQFKNLSNTVRQKYLDNTCALFIRVCICLESSYALYGSGLDKCRKRNNGQKNIPIPNYTPLLKKLYPYN